MAYTLDEFAADCRRILKVDPGPAGRETVRKRLQDLLMNEDFVAAHCGPDASVGTNLLYEDPELGFQILAHIMDRTTPADRMIMVIPGQFTARRSNIPK
jgi:hypothetical protein